MTRRARFWFNNLLFIKFIMKVTKEGFQKSIQMLNVEKIQNHFKLETKRKQKNC